MSDSKSGSKTDLNESNMPLLDDVSIPSLFDNAPHYVFGYIIQKR